MKRSRWSVLALVLFILLLSATVASAASGDDLLSISHRSGARVNAIVVVNKIANSGSVSGGQLLEAAGQSATPVPSGNVTYVVKPGDYLAKIARMYNTTVLALVNANNIPNANLIRVGQVLIIPTAGGLVTPAPPGVTPPPVTPPPVTPPPQPTGFELGGQTQSFANKQLMKDVGMGWVKFQHKWSPGDDPNVVAGRIQDAHGSGFKVLLSITGAQTYPPPNGIDFPKFVEFLRGVAGLGPDAIEVWNEMNIDFEWPAGQIDPASYVNNMLAPGYQAIKGVNPNIIVISGAPAPTGFDNGTNAWADNRYIAGMRAAGAANYMDCIGAHHNAGATSPTVSTGHPGGSHYSWYYQPTLDLYYNTFGGARKVCFTELGYLSGDGFGGLPPNFSWAAGTSVAEHALWLREARDLSRTNGKVRLMIIYNVDFTAFDPAGDPQAGYAMIRPDGSCPACEELKK